MISSPIRPSPPTFATNATFQGPPNILPSLPLVPLFLLLLHSPLSYPPACSSCETLPAQISSITLIRLIKTQNSLGSLLLNGLHKASWKSLLAISKQLGLGRRAIRLRDGERRFGRVGKRG